MAKTKVKVSGVSNVLRNLEKYNKRVSDKLADEILYTGLAIETAVKQDVNVDTGRLKTSYHTEYKLGGRSSFGAYQYKDNTGSSFNGSFSEKVKDGQLLVGSNVKYAGAQEERNPQLLPAKEREETKLNFKVKQILKNG